MSGRWFQYEWQVVSVGVAGGFSMSGRWFQYEWQVVQYEWQVVSVGVAGGFSMSGRWFQYEWQVAQSMYYCLCILKVHEVIFFVENNCLIRVCVYPMP